MNRWIKVGLIILLVLVTLLGGLRLFGNRMLERIIADRLGPLINGNPHRIYDIWAADLKIGAWSGDVVLDSIYIVPRPYALDSLRENEIGKHNILQGTIHRFRIRGLNIIRFFIDKKLSIRSINLDSPDFVVYSDPTVEQASRNIALADVFSEQFKGVRIRRLSVENANITVLDVSQDSLEKVQIDTLSILLEKIHLDQKSLARFKPLPLEHIRTDIGQFIFNTGAKRVQADSIIIDERRDVGSLSLRNLSFAPADPDAPDPRRSRIKARVEQLEVSGFEIDSLYFKQKLIVGRLELTKPVLDVVLDQHYPKPRGERPLLGTIIRGIPLSFTLDSMLIRDGRINYTLIPTGKRPGHLSLTSLNAQGGNFTNDSIRLAENDHAGLVASTRLYDQGQIFLSVDLPITHVRDRMDLDITGGSFDMRILNSFAQPAFGAKIEQGRVQEIRAQYWMDRDTSLGDLVLVYDDLKVGLVAKKDRRKTAKFLSFLANNVVRGHNTPEKGGYRIGLITRRRDPNDDVVRHMWESMFNGIVSVAVPIVAKKGQKAEVVGKSK